MLPKHTARHLFAKSHNATVSDVQHSGPIYVEIQSAEIAIWYPRMHLFLIMRLPKFDTVRISFLSNSPSIQ